MPNKLIGDIKARARSKLSSQEGITLIEILFAAAIVGIAIIGVALMLSRGMEAVVAQGDDRVALYLARQKVEKLAGAGFAALPLGNKVNTTGCPNPPDPNNSKEPCYNEPMLAGTGGQATGSTTLDQQRFTRLTCVRIVQDDNPSLPADTLDPATWTCPACTAGTCTGSTKRVKVAVTPSMMQANPVTIESVIIDPSLSITVSSSTSASTTFSTTTCTNGTTTWSC